MLGIARHHQKQPRQLTFGSYVTVNPNSYSYWSYLQEAAHSPRPVLGGSADVAVFQKYVYPEGLDAEPGLSGFTIVPGVWNISMYMTISVTNASPAAPSVPPPNYTPGIALRQGPDLGGSNIPPYTPPGVKVWQTAELDNSLTTWESYYNGGAEVWRTRTPIELVNSLTGNNRAIARGTGSTEFILTEPTDFWITFDSPDYTSTISHSEILILVIRLA